MRVLILSVLLLSMASPAFADDSICPDRPLKGTASCTVPQGGFQVELTAIDWSRQNDHSARTYNLTLAAPLIKYGLTASTDIELGLTPFERQVTRDATMRSTVTGVGDSELRIKQRFTSEDAKFGVALVPWLKVPTARGELGNGKFEEGLILPVDLKLPGDAQLNVSPEIDRLANSGASGFHAQIVGAVGVTVPLNKAWSVAGELWAANDHDPSGHVHRASADAAVTYQRDRSTQLDAEVDVGLNPATPRLELVVGISRRF